MHKSCVNCVNKFNCETFKLIINEGSDVDLDIIHSMIQPDINHFRIPHIPTMGGLKI